MKLLQNRIKEADYARTVFYATPEPGTKLTEMLVPEYWSHVAKSLKAGSRIEVVSDDGNWFAELYVRAAGPNSAVVALLREHVFGPSAEHKPAVNLSRPVAKPSEYKVLHRGPRKWSVIRNSDKAVMVEDLELQAEADTWLKKHEAEMSVA